MTARTWAFTPLPGDGDLPPLEDWRFATLLGDWEQQPEIRGIQVPLVSYFRDPFGLVHLRGGVVGTPGSPNPFATPLFLLDDDCIPETTVPMDAANMDLVGGVGVSAVFIVGRDAPEFATPGWVVVVFADYEVTFLDGSFRSGS